MAINRCRVLYTQAWSGGGSELSLYELARGLDRDRYEPIAMFSWRPVYQGLFEAVGIKVIILSDILPRGLLPPEVPPERGGDARSGSRIVRLTQSMRRVLVREPRLAFQVARIIKKERIDLVHHNCGMNADRAMVLATYLAKVPQISHFRLFSKLTFVARRLIPVVDVFVYNSEAVCEFYTQQGIPAAKGRVIYNPIDAEAFVPDAGREEVRKELNIAADDCLVSNVGRLAAWKGQDVFLQAMAAVVKTNPHVKALIVGEPGPAPHEQQYAREMRELAKNLGLERHTIFTGLRSDVPRVMAASDIVVHSAIKPEPFGRVIAEALMAGRPVIATAGGGVPEVVDDGVTGLLVPRDDIDAMVAALNRLLSNRDEAVAMGRRARLEAMNRFTVRDHVRAVEQVYSAISDKARCQAFAAGDTSEGR